jgi:hypothetical protein
VKFLARGRCSVTEITTNRWHATWFTKFKTHDDDFEMKPKYALLIIGIHFVYG